MLRTVLQIILLIVLAGAAGAGVYQLASERHEPPVSASAAVHAELEDVESAADLLVYCYKLREIPGVDAVSVRNYLPTSKRAVIAVFYEPAVTSPTLIRRFLRIKAILWDPKYNV